MFRYFVVFQAENESLPMNDVVGYDYELDDFIHIKGLESKLCRDWYGDNRRIILTYFKKL